MNSRTKKVVYIAMLIALAFTVTWLSKFLPPIFAFLKYDPKDIIITIGGFALGPIAAIIISVITCLIEISISSTGFIGALMNIVASCAFAVTASVIFKKIPTVKGAIIGVTAGTLLMVVVMIFGNWLITPLYMAVSREQVVKMLLPVFLPFNLVKGGINAVAVVLLHRPVLKIFRRQF